MGTMSALHCAQQCTLSMGWFLAIVEGFSLIRGALVLEGDVR
jgi:hypothetical protein